MTDPYEQGKKAFEEGKDMSSNPYDIRDNEPAYLQWVYGWDDACNGSFGTAV